MDDVTKNKFATNVANSWKMASNWIMSLAGTLGMIYLAIPEEQEKTIIQHLPIPVWSVPIVLTVIGIIARLWPQKSITPAVAVAKADDTKPTP